MQYETHARYVGCGAAYITSAARNAALPVAYLNDMAWPVDMRDSFAIFYFRGRSIVLLATSSDVIQ